MASRPGPGPAGPAGSVVVLLTAAGQPAGVGFLAGPGEILTCAHVVNVALGRGPRAQDLPAEPVTVEFPLLPAAGRPDRITARVDRWLAPPRQGATGDDIAGLRLAGGALPPGAAAAVLATAAPRAGQVVDLFGYPSVPPRPDGGWVEARARGAVAGGRLQLDVTAGAALRVQPGFSGSPVCDRETGRVVGMLAAASSAGTERDAYAISVEQLMSAWPDALDPAGLARRRLAGQRISLSEITVLHLSGLRFGREAGSGSPDQPAAEGAPGGALRRLPDDLDAVIAEHGLRPDLMIVTGNLTDQGRPSEFEQALRFLAELSDAAGLPRRHVAIVPGPHDVNRAACAAHFARQRAREREPRSPYWAKWEDYAALFADFYRNVPAASFTPDEPWSLFDMPDLRVVVAGLNSTMAESHRDDDHYGWTGETQLNWFADRLGSRRWQGWLRLVAVHHPVTRGAQPAAGSLRDSADADRLLGATGAANLLLHGHGHGGHGQPHGLPSGLLALPAGMLPSPAGPDGGESATPAPYQLLTIRADGLTRYLRRYPSGEDRWTDDALVSRTDPAGPVTIPYALADVTAAFGAEERTAPEDDPVALSGLPGAHGDRLIDRVAEATRVSHPDATVTVRPEAGYLRVSAPLPGGGCAQWPVGVIDEPEPALVREFIDRVHATFASTDPQQRSELVYARGLADRELIDLARRFGVHLRSLVDYQGLIDLRPLVAEQDQRIASDARYPDALYVPQRFRDLHADPASHDGPQHGLLEQAITWLDTDGPRFLMILGEFGRGKPFLLRQLARSLPGRLPAMLPVLVELHGLEKAPSLDELLAQHLVRRGMRTVELAKLRYMVESGRLALLFDGFDELALRVSYDHAADYLQTLLGAATGNAKIVLTSRTQHFQSTADVRTALGNRVAMVAGRQIAVIEDFTDDQIRQFLVRHYAGDEAAARDRFELLDQVHDLLGLSHNPRMLSFIADLDEPRLREIQRQRGAISAAELYREIISSWLVNEAERQRHRAGLPSLDERERHDACTALALRLWVSTAPTIPLADLSAEVADVLTGLAERGYSAAEAAQAVGSGTLLVGTADGSFTFVHPSVMEWLVAEAGARCLRDGEPARMLAARRLSRLMTDFLCDLAGHDVAARWAAGVLADSAAAQTAKQNALDIMVRLGQDAPPPGPTDGPPLGRQSGPPLQWVDLGGTDLRGQDLSGQDLSGANLSRANLSGMRLERVDLSGADLRYADFSGARLIGCHLANADLTGSHWSRAVLAGVTGLDELTGPSDLAAAGVLGPDVADPMLAPNGSVSCVAMSPADEILVIGHGSTAEIIDLVSAQPLRVLAGHLGPVTSVAFSPDGTLVATASEDSTARLWDTATGRHRATLTGHSSWVTGVAFSPDGTLIATASHDGTARLWHTATGHHAAILTGHAGQVTGVAFSPDSTLVATASHDSTARLWHTATGHHAATLTGHTGWITGVAFSPDGTLVATASADGTARLWDTATGQHRSTLSGGGLISTRRVLAAVTTPAKWLRTPVKSYTDGVTGVTFSSDGTLVATASEDGTARLWYTASVRRRTTLAGHFGPANGVAFSPDCTLVATTAYDQTARLWYTATGRHRATLTGHAGWVTGVAFSPDGTLIATASADGTLRFWDTAATTLAILRPFRDGGCAILLPDGSYKLAGDPAGELWWAVKLARFEPGEVDPLTPAVRRLPAEAPLPWAR